MWFHTNIFKKLLCKTTIHKVPNKSFAWIQSNWNTWKPVHMQLLLYLNGNKQKKWFQVYGQDCVNIFQIIFSFV